MRKIIDLLGQRFGRLTVIKDSGKRYRKKEVIWLCQCDCGNLTEVRGYYLRSGHTQSCGCLHREITSKIGKSKKGKKLSEETRKKISESLKGKKLSEEHRQKISKALQGKKRPYISEIRKGMKFSKETRKRISKAQIGKKMSIETRMKMSESHKGEKSSFWKGGIDRKVYKHYNNLNYRLWRDKVFERDDYTCQICKAKSGNGKSIFLHPHHIKSYTHYPELRFDIDNGLTLCIDCHKNLHRNL